MSFDFVETVTLEMPDVERQLAAFSEGESSKHGLIIELAAIHEGLTANYNNYTADELEKALESWVTPYPKPIIKNHDPAEEPIGRVIAAKMDTEDDGTPYIRLQVAVTDSDAIGKFADGRYLTGSVGGKADEALCSICGTNWSEGAGMSLPCKHKRGTTYKGKLAHINMKRIKFKEYSIVNMPADHKSSVRNVSTKTVAEEGEETSDGWVRPARVFDLNMDKEEIIEFTESENRNVLSGMKKKDSSPLYLQLKGAFLSALAVAESDAENKESDVVQDEDLLEQEEDDVLAVSEELSTDLAAQTEPESEAGETEEAAEEEEEAAEEAEETSDEETAEAPAEGEEEDTEEGAGERPEGQAKPSGDVDPETSKGAPKNRQSEEAEEESTEETAEEETEEETDLNEQSEALESRVSELEAQLESLQGENAKLRTVLKRSLAERVVDAKITLGLAERDAREGLLTEHLERSSRSLADSLKDLAAMPVTSRGATDYTEFPTVEGEGAVEDEEGDEKRTITLGAEEVEAEKPVNPEDIFVDALMGRRKL